MEQHYDDDLDGEQRDYCTGTAYLGDDSLPSPFSPTSAASPSTSSSLAAAPSPFFLQPGDPRNYPPLSSVLQTPSIIELPTTDRSCARCKERKQKCSRTFPACERCTKRKESCEYQGVFRVEASSRPEGFQTAPRPGGTLRRIPEAPPSTTAFNLISNTPSKDSPIAAPISPLDTPSRIHSIFTADLAISHHLLLFETLLSASQTTSPRSHSSPPDIATSLVWYLLDAAADSCSLRLPGLRGLKSRIPAYKSRLQNLDVEGKLAVVVLCLIGTRTCPQSTIFGVSSADTSAQVLEVGARRDRIFKALVIDAVELAGIAANVSSRATAECLVGLTQVLVDAFEHQDCRIVTRMAWEMLAGLEGRAGEFELVMGLELLKNDSYTSAILQRPCVVNIAELGPSLNIPDFAQAGFGVISNPRFQQQGSSSLSLDDLERNLAIASGWTSNCYRVFSSIAIDLNRSQLDWDLAASHLRALWNRMDFVHGALQGLQRAIANSDTNLAPADALQDYALLVVGVDSRLLDVFLLLHTRLLRLEAERGARGAYGSMVGLLAESQERVRKGLKLFAFYGSLYLASQHQELVYKLVWELEILPEWTKLASQSFGSPGGPTSEEVELTGDELELFEESVRLATFYTPIAERRLAELESRHQVAAPFVGEQVEAFSAGALWTNPQPATSTKHDPVPEQWLPCSPTSEYDDSLLPDEDHRWNHPYYPVAELPPHDYLSPRPLQDQPHAYDPPPPAWIPPPHFSIPSPIFDPQPPRMSDEDVRWRQWAEQFPAEPHSEERLRGGVGDRGSLGMDWQG